MKTVFMSLVSFLFAATAFAMPAVGDQAHYSLSQTQGGQSMTGTLDQAITSVDAAGLYNVQSTITVEGQSNVQNEKKSAQDLVSDAMIADALANCANYGGTLASVTVPAGTFNTCGLPADNGSGTVWVGAVAFGLVKADVTNAQGTHTVIELLSFKNGL